MVTIYCLTFTALVRFERYFETETEVYDYAKQKHIPAPFEVYPRTVTHQAATIYLRNLY